LPRLALNHDPPDLHSQVAGITGVNHCAHPKDIFFTEKKIQSSQDQKLKIYKENRIL
jgi:hypothetical protein